MRELVDLYLQQTAAEIVELQAAISAGSRVMWSVWRTVVPVPA